MEHEFNDVNLLLHDIYRRSLEEQSGIISRNLKNCALLIYTGESLISICEENQQEKLKNEEKAFLENFLKRMVVFLWDSKGNQDIVTKLAKDFLTKLYESNLIKSFILNQKELSSWEEIDEELNLLWKSVDDQEAERKLFKVSSKFLSAEAALFWVQRFGDSEVAEVEFFLKEVKTYLQKKAALRDDISMRLFEPENLRKFLTEERNNYVNIRDSDNFFLRWNALAIQYKRIIELDNQIINKEKNVRETRSFIKNSIRRYKNPSQITKPLKLLYHYENLSKSSSIFFENHSQITVEANAGALEISSRDLKGKNVKTYLKKEIITVGRMECDWEINDYSLSKKQLEIFSENGNFYVSCLSPTNPTYFKLKPKLRYNLSLNMVINIGFEYYLFVKDSSPVFVPQEKQNLQGEEPIHIQTFLRSEATNLEKEEFEKFFKKSREEVNIFFLTIFLHLFILNINIS